MHFTILWSFFEYKALNKQASPQRIKDHVKTFSIIPNEELLRNIQDYFAHRYIITSGFNAKFSALKWKNNNDKKFVSKILREKTPNTNDLMTALLLLVYRLRNNMFHGEKHEYALDGQSENFNHANSLLTIAIEAT